MKARIINDRNGNLGMISMIREIDPDEEVISVVTINSGLFATIINCGIEQRRNHIKKLLSEGVQ